MQPRSHITATAFRPLHDHVFVTELETGPSKTSTGIIIPDDNMTERGIRPRWAKVFAVGPDVTDLVPGNWILIDHVRWTNSMDIEFPDGMVRVWRVEYPDSVHLVADEDPREHKPTVL